MSADCSSVEIEAERIELGLGSPGIRTNIYVSRYWTKVAPSVLDATRSDISPGTGFFVTRGRNYETGHFSQTAAGCPVFSEAVRDTTLNLRITHKTFICEFSLFHRRLKNFLRVTMLQKRLNNIAILHVYQDIAKDLDFE
ncbi:hypothetical protein ALC62_11690 [Cyphomyrmex costatus]|uniref:Uncharacterized protein n=1 Tax=Cyphomyrmex costatus TaxID=456900 RepID=A0A195CBA6_9HYME|nr:hypothetical protein ALC62_11690 [Cyphomyrmex costatus]